MNVCVRIRLAIGWAGSGDQVVSHFSEVSMPVVTEHLVNRPVWFDFSPFNLSAAKAPHSELFGWTFDDLPVELGWHTVAFAKGISAAAIAPKTPGQDAVPVTRTVYFGVIDANGHIVANGGSMIVPPMTIPPPVPAAWRSRSTPTARGSVCGNTAALRARAIRGKMTLWHGEPTALLYWMPYLTVDYLDAANSALKKHGETVVNGRVPAPTAGSWSPKTRMARFSRT